MKTKQQIELEMEVARAYVEEAEHVLQKPACGRDAEAARKYLARSLQMLQQLQGRTGGS